MDSDALRTFVAIHRAGGFSAAAALLHRSQPAISRRIAALEEELGVPLFERAAGGTVLSQAGQVLLPHAERALAALQDSADALRAFRAGHGGPVSLAAVGTLAGTGLTAVLKRFAGQFPGAALSLRTATSAEVSDLVRRGEVTIGLRYFDDPSPDLVCHSLGAERLLVVCAPGHPLAGAKIRSLRELKAEHWFAFPDVPDRRDVSAANIFAQFLVRGIADIRWAPVDSLTAQKRLVEAGFGIALLPESSVGEERAAGALAVIAVGDLKAANPVSVITRRNGYLSEASRQLLDILKSAYR
ncbi:MAG: LysR family transcriptional regulator [Parvibaculum sp.]